MWLDTTGYLCYKKVGLVVSSFSTSLIYRLSGVISLYLPHYLCHLMDLPILKTVILFSLSHCNNNSHSFNRTQQLADIRPTVAQSSWIVESVHNNT